MDGRSRAQAAPTAAMKGIDMNDSTAIVGAEITREALHTRSIAITGYRRSDGLYEVEGRLLDTKPFDFRPPSDERMVRAGEAIHHMGVRIVFDVDMTVRDVIAVTDSAPYAACHDAPPTLKSLIGLRMSSGWSAEVKRRLSGAASCVHLAGLMVPMAATAFQSMTLHRRQQAEPMKGDAPAKIDSCLAYSRHGDLVNRRWPRFFIAKADQA
jgi:hypothetical protein